MSTLTCLCGHDCKNYVKDGFLSSEDEHGTQKAYVYVKNYRCHSCNTNCRVETDMHWLYKCKKCHNWICIDCYPYPLHGSMVCKKCTN